MPGLLQRAFDWLAPAPADPPPANAGQKSPPGYGFKPFDASKKIAIEPSAGSLFAPTPQQHPQANRAIVLAGLPVAYVLQRARRRSIGMVVGAEGLVVRAPAWATLATIDAALHEKAGWIVRKLHEAAQRQQHAEQTRTVWADGATLPYLGAPLVVRLGAAGRSAILQRQAEALAEGVGHGAHPAAAEAPPARCAELHLPLPLHTPPAQMRAAVQAWWVRTARTHLQQRLDHFAPLLGVRYTSLRLNQAHTRWGSASSSGAIRLNWRLLHHRPVLIDYVVAHELAHLRVMDHSPRFWATVAEVVPDHAALRRELRQANTPRWDEAM